MKNKLEHLSASHLNAMLSEPNQEFNMPNDQELISKVGKNNVEIIKEWLSKKPHLPKVSGMNFLTTKVLNR